MKVKTFIFCVFAYFVLFSIDLSARPIAKDARYGTHMPALITAVVNTTGPVLELGCGDFSTPLLHAICSVKKRFLFTTESNRQWMNYFLDLACDWHQFQHVPSFNSWDEIGSGLQWSVVFVDHAPKERRVMDIVRLRPYTEIFVVHDTEIADYRFEPVFATFKYKYVYKRYDITTTLVSDTIDVVALFKN